jgi:glutathione peroxidase
MALTDHRVEAGDIRWRFEKFLVRPDGTPTRRCQPVIEPESGELVTAIDAVLPT